MKIGVVKQQATVTTLSYHERERREGKKDLDIENATDQKKTRRRNTMRTLLAFVPLCDEFGFAFNLQADYMINTFSRYVLTI
jgi:hypothetical protein